MWLHIKHFSIEKKPFALTNFAPEYVSRRDSSRLLFFPTQIDSFFFGYTIYFLPDGKRVACMVRKAAYVCTQLSHSSDFLGGFSPRPLTVSKASSILLGN